MNKNHIDHIQGFGDSLSYGVSYTVYRGNTMFSVTDPTRLLYEHDDWIKQWDAEDIWDQVKYPGEQFGDYTGYAGASIGLTSPQANSNLLFENNIIFSQGRVPATVFGGIKINGGSDILVTNNTVINRDDSGDAAAG